MSAVDYTRATTPDGYVCGNCKASGCKLWRESATFAIRLLCARCALASQGKLGPVDERGCRVSEYGTTDQIGYFVPAVPTANGVAYWGYTSVPDAGVAWWKALPTYAPEAAS